MSEKQAKVPQVPAAIPVSALARPAVPRARDDVERSLFEVAPSVTRVRIGAAGRWNDTSWRPGCSDDPAAPAASAVHLVHGLTLTVTVETFSSDRIPAVLNPCSRLLVHHESTSILEIVVAEEQAAIQTLPY